MMARFVQADRDTPFLLPPSVDEWLPQGHLARFIVEIIDRIDLAPMVKSYAGRGSAAHHPSVLMALLIYGYATGVHSSRAIERATYDSVAFRFLAANTHPDHDTLSHFRKRFLNEFKAIFLQVLEIAADMKLLKLGTISLDGSKIKANASKHSALSWKHAQALRQQLQAEIDELLKKADEAESVPDGVSLPEELALRQERLAGIDAALARIEERVAERDAREKADYESRIAGREAIRQSGKKPRGKEPVEPVAGPRDTDQVNLTDEESRIMPVAGGGFEQAYNAQTAVDADTMLVLAVEVTQACNDKQQVVPMLEHLQALPESLGRPETLLTDNGYYSEANVTACAKAGLEPLFALGREAHRHPLARRLAVDPPVPTGTVSPLELMRHTLSTRDGQTRYGRRKSTVEPVFGIIKQVMRFRQFLLRGRSAADGEWNLVCLAWNIKRLAILFRK
jgi:transposase